LEEESSGSYVLYGIFGFLLLIIIVIVVLILTCRSKAVPALPMKVATTFPADSEKGSTTKLTNLSNTLPDSTNVTLRD
jgi:hypothetical protein